MNLILEWFLIVYRLFVEGVAAAKFFFMSVRGPTAAILSLRKPSVVFALRASLSAVQIRSWRICASPLSGNFPSKTPVLGAAYGTETTALLKVICLSVLVSVSWPNTSFACKSLYYPQSFPLEELKEYDQVYVVNVETVNYSKPLDESWYAPNFDFEGQIVEVLKGMGKPGDTIRGATDSTQEPQARCPIFLEAGRTYLLFLSGNSSPYVLPRFGSMYTPSSDSYTPSAASRFRQYITDIRRAQKKRHKKQQ